MDLTTKRLQIESITDEVGKLHPLLENIFPKMPNVKGVEYTHGQYERGADFIVEVENPTTRRTNHVGVVVKCGKIGGGKVSDVEEQIRECAEERAYHVMKTVRCAEVWVFTSGGYSERAKEKMQERFKERKIEFFGPSDIADFVDDYYSYFWQDLPHELGIYLQALRGKINALDKMSGIVTSSDAGSMYIELDTYERIKKTYHQNTRSTPEVKNVEFFQEVETSRVALLEAEMGFGKSKVARRLALSYCDATNFFATKTVPVFASFRQLIDIYNGNIHDLITAELSIAASCLENSEIKILVILDGIDECSNAERTTAELFDDAIQQIKAQENYKAVITSRPLKSLVDKAALYSEARVFGIRPLSLKKIVGFLETTCSKANLPARLFEDLKRSPLFKQLPHSPIAAALFSNLLTQSQQEVPQSLTELYSKSMELMLGRWEQRKELATEKEFKTSQLIAELLATFYVENKLIYVARSEVEEMIAEYLKKRNIGISPSAIQNILFERSNIFSIDTDSDTVSFRHRSFSEYLCAQKKAKDRSLNVAESALDPYWTNVFFFYSGTLLDCPEVLDELNALKPAGEVDQWMKLISVPSYLMAAYQTEFERVESNLLSVLQNAAELFLQVKAGNTKTRLKELSEMHLLYLFKGLISDMLGYEFFKPGFTKVRLRIEAEDHDEQLKYYALFFLGCAEVRCGNTDSFDYLIKNIGASRLPLSLSFAIKGEMESNVSLEKKALLKYHLEKVRRLLSLGSKSTTAERMAMQAKIDNLYERPLSIRVATPQK